MRGRSRGGGSGGPLHLAAEIVQRPGLLVAAERAVRGVPLPGVLEHEVRQRRPKITALFLQEAEDPQPGAVPSALLLEVALIGPRSDLHR